jgi:amino acid transporter
MRDQLGSEMEKTLLVAVTFAFFGAGIVLMTACSRTVFAMSRDARFAAHRLPRRVNPRTHTPVPATILIFVLGVVLMVALPGAALLKLIEVSTILPAIIYGFAVVLYLAVRKRLIERRARSTSGASSCRLRSARWCGQSPRCLHWFRPPRLSSPSWSWSACS